MFNLNYFRTGLKLVGLLALRELLHGRYSRLIAYSIGVFLGWVVCSEYNYYLDTGIITTFPWE